MSISQASDNFHRADSGSLGVNYASVSGFTGVQIISNQASGVGGGDNAVRWIKADWPNLIDQYVEGVIGVIPPSGLGGLSLLFRMNTSDTFYFGQLTPGSSEGTHISVQTVIGGAFNLIKDIVYPYVEGDRIRFSIVGTRIRVNINGGPNILDFTNADIDGSIVGGASVGLGMEGTTGTWESWAAGDPQNSTPIYLYPDNG